MSKCYICWKKSKNGYEIKECVGFNVCIDCYKKIPKCYICWERTHDMPWIKTYSYFKICMSCYSNRNDKYCNFIEMEALYENWLMSDNCTDSNRKSGSRFFEKQIKKALLNWEDV